VRFHLIPLLKKYNPAISKTLYNASLAIADDYDFINVEMKKHKISKVSQFLKIHPALQKRLIRKKIEKLRGNLKDIEAAHIDEILKMLKSKKSKKQLILLKGLKLARKGDRLTISKHKKATKVNKL
jgi:tRNA(Ile)-lysidine synthase